ncbi:hypothetical protein EAL2_808p02850 (plasmid) [Peptoclostridium acidaminophilum DSM 3953]|uniref:Cytochrome b5 heme-binding domain-containing protein n=1 Tax=Peptoclostridium acidaminophilum DSM 3953 TaxID=1286171 RepID=W8TA63_PEPAC|nr:cytochrome b5 domain-containing protein [Peptoclostridium acidaminophilum]AHM57790.1 hypothetical protein EAL2_808p02850 [Peptoclostridium acidaminophilum DSM 3953]
MKTRVLSLAFSIVFALAVLGGCSNQEQTQEPQNQAQENGQEQGANEAGESLEITLDELAKYNGKDGNPAYVAVDGIVYEVTEHPNWNEGMHGKVSAGQDISQMLKDAPHGYSKLEGLKAVGKIVE